MVIAAVLGGGRGSRMGAQCPKQFMPLGGEPVYMRSLRAFVTHPRVDAAVFLAPAEYVAAAEEQIRAAFAGQKPVAVLPGGESRGETLLEALRYVREACGLAGSVLLTHDAARPFVTARMIDENIEGALAHGAANTCVPATDTVFLSGDGRFISSVPARSSVFHAQTPQTFLADRLAALIEKLPPADYAAMTDGCSVFTYFGLPVYMVRGEETNIKITYPGDLQRAEQILASGV